MKKTVYSGLSTKCLILTASVLERHSYNEMMSKKTMEWFIRTSLGNYIGTANATYLSLIQNVNPILVETREVTYNNNIYYLNSFIIAYKLPDKASREIVSLYMNRSLRNLSFPEEEGMEYPMMGLFKIVGGDGGYSSKLVVHNTLTRQSEELMGWFYHQSQTQNKFNHPVLSINTDVIGYNKYSSANHHYYGSLPQYQIEVALYDNCADAINEKAGFWLHTIHISSFNQDYGLAPNINKCKLNAYIYQGTLVIADNVNGLASIKEKLENSPSIMSNLDILVVNQYSLISSNNGNMLVSSIGSGINRNTVKYRAMTLLIMNKDKIVEATPNTRNNDRVIDGNILYMKNKMQKLQFRINVSRNLEVIYGMSETVFVVPFEQGKNTHLLALELLKVYMTEGLQEGVKDRYFYSLLLNEDQNAKDDVLMDWFRKCSATAKSDEEKLKDAYQNLKKGLVEEYQSIEKYLAANNFSDKKPVPAIRVAEEFARSPMKKVAFDFGRDVITSINYTRLDKAVETKYIMLKYIIPWIDRRGMKGFVKGQTPLNTYYDKAANTITLNSAAVIKEHIERIGR